VAEAKCQKCGAPFDFDSATKFAKCKYCDSQMYIDRSGSGFFYMLPFQMDDRTAEAIFRRWTAGSNMAKELETNARIVSMRPFYFPVYMFKRKYQGRETEFVMPARSTTLPGMHALKIPAGDIKVFDQKVDIGNVPLEQPDISMMAYLGNMAGEPVEQALVYFPIFHIRYEFEGAQFDVVVNGSSQEIYATYFPPRKALSYIAIGLGGFAACTFISFCIVFNPVMGLIGLLLTIPAIFMGGLWVASHK